MRKLKKSELKRVYGAGHDNGQGKSKANVPFDNPGSASYRGSSADLCGGNTVQGQTSECLV